MSWELMSEELDGFDADALRELLEERLIQGGLRDLDHELRELCGCWVVALDWSPQIACRSGVGAAAVSRALGRLHQLMLGLRDIYSQHPLGQDPEATVRQVMAESWRLVARLDAVPDRFVDAVCWYFEAAGRPLGPELEDELETLVLEGLMESEPSVLLDDVAAYAAHSLG